MYSTAYRRTARLNDHTTGSGPELTNVAVARASWIEAKRKEDLLQDGSDASTRKKGGVDSCRVQRLVDGVAKQCRAGRGSNAEMSTTKPESNAGQQTHK